MVTGRWCPTWRVTGPRVNHHHYNLCNHVSTALLECRPSSLMLHAVVPVTDSLAVLKFEPGEQRPAGEGLGGRQERVRALELHRGGAEVGRVGQALLIDCSDGEVVRRRMDGGHRGGDGKGSCNGDRVQRSQNGTRNRSNKMHSITRTSPSSMIETHRMVWTRCTGSRRGSLGTPGRSRGRCGRLQPYASAK